MGISIHTIAMQDVTTALDEAEGLLMTRIGQPAKIGEILLLAQLIIERENTLLGLGRVQRYWLRR